ncbi:hypothetical protein HMSSN139_13960 [Paenibacillus sp. HMSSN-139]|nr:hypothetical protein HMSSN139_13960 [Paenibacillus sp. HMSSN-139]
MILWLLRTQAYTIPEGYHNGQGRVTENYTRKRTFTSCFIGANGTNGFDVNLGFIADVCRVTNKNSAGTWTTLGGGNC